MGIPALPGLPTFKRHQKSDLMLILVIEMLTIQLRKQQ